MDTDSRSRNWLTKTAKVGFRGYPVGTVAFYGPDDRQATKVAVGVIAAENDGPTAMQKWFSESSDVRLDSGILDEAIAFLQRHTVKSVAMVDGIFGCPHEEGIDYQGEVCPHCPFWADRDRFAQSRARVLAEVTRQNSEGELP